MRSTPRHSPLANETPGVKRPRVDPSAMMAEYGDILLLTLFPSSLAQRPRRNATAAKRAGHELRTNKTKRLAPAVGLDEGGTATLQFCGDYIINFIENSGMGYDGGAAPVLGRSRPHAWRRCTLLPPRRGRAATSPSFWTTSRATARRSGCFASRCLPATPADAAYGRTMATEGT